MIQKFEKFWDNLDLSDYEIRKRSLKEKININGKNFEQALKNLLEIDHMRFLH